MSTIVIVRHAEYESIGQFLKGRLAGVHLNSTGQAQAERLGERLSSMPIAAVYSSPLERARETAEPIARHAGLTVGILPALVEVDCGDWTGCKVQDMLDDPQWKRFHSSRSRALIPGGERLVDLQKRMLAAFEELAERHGDETVVVVSHGDPIRAILCLYLGMPLDFLDRLEIRPASITILELTEGRPRLNRLNDTGDPL